MLHGLRWHSMMAAAKFEGDVVLRPIQYEADKTKLTGYLADGCRGKKAPAVLIAHEAIGMNEHIKGRAELLAGLGFVAFALDLYGAANLDLAEAQNRSAELMRTPGLLLCRARAGLDVLLSNPSVDGSQVAAIGFCQGGSTVLELARSGAPLLAVVGFHPGFQRPAGSVNGRIGAKVLMMSGDADPVITESDRVSFVEEMRGAAADWQLHLFGGVGHSYTNPRIDEYGFPGFKYDLVADRRSWQLMRDMLEEVFGPRN